MECYYCKSLVWKIGKHKGRQIYRCKSCKRKFVETIGSLFYNMNFPEAIIRFAVKVFYKYRLSLADTARLLGDLGIKLSDEAVREWVQRFTPLMAKELKFPRRYTKQWHIDESFVTVGSNHGYLWTVVDSNNNIVSILLSDKRDQKSAIAVLKNAKREAGFMPDVIVSDDYPAYPKAIRKAFGRGKVKHARSHFKNELFLVKGKLRMLSNNRIEGLFSHLKEHYHRFRGFKSFTAGNVIAQGTRIFHNIRIV